MRKSRQKLISLQKFKLRVSVTVSPYVGFYGDWRFSCDSALVGVEDGGSGRAIGGVTMIGRNGATLSLGGEFGGLGAGYELWSPKREVAVLVRSATLIRGEQRPFAMRQLTVANRRFGSFATWSSQQQARPCPLCPESGSCETKALIMI